MNVAGIATLSQSTSVSTDAAIVQASLGNKLDDWDAAKKVFWQRLSSILSAWDVPDSLSYLDHLSSFSAPPHTVQRLAELLLEPRKWYSDSAKFTRALVRVLSVTSTTVDFSEEKGMSSVSHEDSSLVPIPWLARSSIDEAEMTTMPTRNSANMTEGLQSNNLNPAAATHLSGSAPMDATDYGPQCEEVQETIALNAAALDADTLRDSNGFASHGNTDNTS